MMYLHENKSKFKNIIDDITLHTCVRADIIEKDYYVFTLLKLMKQKSIEKARKANEQNNRKRKDLVKDTYNNGEIIFKGGTSLSKGYGIIKRFSEDIDICLPADKLSKENARKRVVNSVLESLHDIGMTDIGPTGRHPIERSGRYNNIKGDYNTVIINSVISTNIQIEMMHNTPEYPVDITIISSYITEYMKIHKMQGEIRMYNMDEFTIPTVSYLRTFIDKLFAITEYYQRGRVTRYSRHIYDIYKLIEYIDWTDRKFVNSLKELLDQVRDTRANDKMHTYYNDTKDIDLKQEIIKLLQEDYFKNDYEMITSNVLLEDVAYETCKNKIMDWLNSNILL